MFTGIIEDLGKVIKVTDEEGIKIFEIQSKLALEMKEGESLAHNGVCLSVFDLKNKNYKVAAIPQTLKTATLELKEGDNVNLERPLSASGRFDGHMVQGHVDSIGLVSEVNYDGKDVRLKVQVLQKFLPYLIEKGSICMHGISLTISSLQKNNFEVSIIPLTLKHTNLSLLKIGSEVNLEFDMIAKYLLRFKYLNIH